MIIAPSFNSAKERDAWIEDAYNALIVLADSLTVALDNLAECDMEHPIDPYIEQTDDKVRSARAIINRIG